MNNKKKLSIAFAILLPLLFVSIFASWVIVNRSEHLPSYNPNSTSLLFEAYDGQTVTYNGTYQSPTSKSALIDDNNIEISYRTAGSTDKYKAGLPHNCGEYDLLLQDSTNTYVDDVVRFKISQATPTCSVTPIISDMYEGDDINITNESSIIFYGVKNEEISGSLTLSSNVVYPDSSTNTTETIDVNFTFTPNSSFSANYTTATISSSVTLKAVAYVKNTTNTYFGTIQKALTSTIGNDVYVVAGLHKNITSNITISSGKSLYLPYQGESIYQSDSEFETFFSGEEYSGKFTSFIDTSSANVTSYRNICLNMKSGADISISSGGNLYLGGEFKSKGISRYYSEINLDTNSKIEVNGNFTCYGYVKENSDSYKNTSQANYSSYLDNSYDSGRGIFVGSTGTLLTHIAIHDIKQGSTLSTLLNNNICPFNLFNFPDLQTYVEVLSGGIFKATAHLVVAGQTLRKTVAIVSKTISSSTSDSSLFYVTTGKIAFEYCTTTPLYSKQNTTTKIFISGNVTQGYLYISQGATIDTRETFLPISYLFQVYMCNGSTYNSDYQIKFMQGSLLKICENSSFTINNTLIFYESNSLSAFTSSDGVSYGNTTPARLINNGTFILGSNGVLGAHFETENTNGTAKIDLSNVSQSDLTATSNESTGNVNIPAISTTADFRNEETQEIETLLLKANETFSSANNDNVWVGNALTSYKVSINVAQTNYLHNLYSFSIYTSTSADGTDNLTTLIEDSNLTKYELECESGTYIKVVVKDAASTIISDSNLSYSSSTWYSVNKDLTFTINPNQGFKISFSLGGGSGAGSQTFTIKYGTTSSNLNNEYKSTTYSGSEIFPQDIYFKISPSSWGGSGYNAKVTKTTYDEAGNKTSTILHNDGSQWAEGPYLLDGDYQFAITNWKACITSGTLLTLADGTTKKVENLLDTDMLLVFNHETGKFESAPIIFVDRDEWKYYDIVNLEFSNGTKTRLIYEHGYFDLTLNKYVYITEANYQDYIGHEFAFYDGDKVNSVTLTNSYITNEYVGCYSPVTAYHLNYFVDGMLSMPGGIEGLFNIFEYNDDMTYDIEKMNEDIEKYGLYTYEDFKDYLPYEVYLAFPGPYLKVSVEKGYITFEEIIGYIEQYLGRHGLDK